MSSWGRFSTRGSSYRGGSSSSYRGSRSDGRGSRGGFSSRGRGSFKPSSSSYYESSSRPSSSFSSSRSSYQSSQSDDLGYRRSSYRPDTSSYSSSRDYSHHSDEIPRKRIRTDSYSPTQATGSRRSHESYDYSRPSRYTSESRSSSNMYTGEVHKIFKKRPMEHRSLKEDFRRKEMLPPPPPPPMSRIRTSFRGRSMRPRRGILRRETIFTRERPSFTSAVRRSTTELLALRKKNLLRLKRLRETAAIKHISDRQKEESGDDKASADTKSEDKTEKKKEKKKEDGEAEDGDKSKSDDKDEPRTDYFGNPFLKLECPHCNANCITFKEYISHLYKPSHIKSMKDKNTQLKATLAKLRTAQRAKQKKAEEDDLTSLNATTMFCPICKLNYSQERSVHQATETHRKIKSFLLPYCRICHISFKSPMLYENHICSLDHIKKKHHLDQRLEKTKGSAPAYLDNFMVLDSVGSGDEGEDGKDETATPAAADGASATAAASPTKKKPEAETLADDDEDLNLGSEFIHSVKALYCEVCRSYLSRIADTARVIKIHCRSKIHLKCYLKYGNEELLQKIADEEFSGNNGVVEGKDVKKEGAEHHDGSVDEEANIDDKLWADVGDLLNQVEPIAKSDDEEEEEGGRYDRFKSIEKKKETEGEGEAKINGEETEMKVKVEEQTPVKT